MNTTTETTRTLTGKAKSIEDLPQRRVFDNPEIAIQYAAETQELDGADSVVYVVHGQREDGTVDFTQYPADWEVYAVRLTERAKDEDGNAVNVTRAFVVHPAPSLDILLADENGRAMVESVIQKELNHRFVRSLRPVIGDFGQDSAKVADAVAQMPTSLEHYLDRRGGGSSAALEAFNTLWRPILDELRARIPALKRAKITKPELQRALSNAAFASYHYQRLEDAGLFEIILKALIMASNRRGMDATQMQAWLDNRANESYVIDDETDEIDTDALDLDALIGGMDTDAE